MHTSTDAEKATHIKEARRLLDNLIAPELVQTICQLIEAGHECEVYANAWHTNLWLNGVRIESADITAEAIDAAVAKFGERF